LQDEQNKKSDDSYPEAAPAAAAEGEVVEATVTVPPAEATTLEEDEPEL
jgi:hypothetical protein